MSYKYKLKFLPSALKDWNKLDNTIKEQFKKKLVERVSNPCITADKIRGFDNYYKIKLRSIGYRLVYKVIENELAVIVILINKREKIYKRLK